MGFCIVLNHKGDIKFSACETEQPESELKLYLSISGDGSEAIPYSKIGAGGFKFGGFRMQGQPDGYSVSNIFEVL